MKAPQLFTYFRSGAAHRVRIGLALKGVAYDSIPVHLVRSGGEHLLPAFRAINPQARVPAMRLADGMILAQSPASATLESWNTAWVPNYRLVVGPTIKQGE